MADQQTIAAADATHSLRRVRASAPGIWLTLPEISTLSAQVG